MRTPHTTAALATLLALSATGTATTLSILTGLQRGGTLPERLVWVAVGLVLVLSAHLLPALVRTASTAVRIMAIVLWIACMAAAGFGHTTFFLLAQRHAGEQRADSLTPATLMKSGRSLTEVMAQRANVTAQLAVVEAKRCTGDCRTWDQRRVTLAAKLDALDAEASDVRRNETERDRVTVRRDALLADPVTSRLAALLGTTAAPVDLLTGLSFAAVLEGVACLLWSVALRPSRATSAVPAATLAEVTPVATAIMPMEPAVATVTTSQAVQVAGRRTASPGHGTTPISVAPSPGAAVSDDELVRLAQDVAAGLVRATVADIRRYLGCSQAKAITLRRRLAQRNVTA